MSFPNENKMRRNTVSQQIRPKTRTLLISYKQEVKIFNKFKAARLKLGKGWQLLWVPDFKTSQLSYHLVQY